MPPSTPVLGSVGPRTSDGTLRVTEDENRASFYGLQPIEPIADTGLFVLRGEPQRQVPAYPFPPRQRPNWATWSAFAGGPHGVGADSAQDAFTTGYRALISAALAACRDGQDLVTQTVPTPPNPYYHGPTPMLAQAWARGAHAAQLAVNAVGCDQDTLLTMLDHVHDPRFDGRGPR